VFAGDASYSIYLLHYIVFALAATWSANYVPMMPAWACEPWRFGWIFVCCLLSSLHLAPDRAADDRVE
jgi:exopolysaccharide production protein ExoZ